MKVAFCIPTITKPYQKTLDSLAASVPLLDEAGIEHYLVSEVGCPYISAARSMLLRKALDKQVDAVVFIDHDMSWNPEALLKLIQTKGDVVSGLYRFKKDEVEYMGKVLSDSDGFPIVRPEDGAIKAGAVPAGFLKVTKEAIDKFMERYPELMYWEYRFRPFVDLFNHGAHKGTWYGEDYAFSRNWLEIGDIWVVPDIDLDHNGGDGKCYEGNYHQFLLRQEGGSLAEES